MSASRDMLRDGWELGVSSCGTQGNLRIPVAFNDGDDFGGFTWCDLVWSNQFYQPDIVLTSGEERINRKIRKGQRCFTQ